MFFLTNVISISPLYFLRVFLLLILNLFSLVCSFSLPGVFCSACCLSYRAVYSSCVWWISPASLYTLSWECHLSWRITCSMYVGVGGRERWRWLKPRDPGVPCALPRELRELADGHSFGGRASGIVLWGQSSPVCHLPTLPSKTSRVSAWHCSFSRDFFLSWSHLPIPAVDSSPSQPDSSIILIFPPSAAGQSLLFICLKMTTKQDRKEKHPEP